MLNRVEPQIFEAFTMKLLLSVSAMHSHCKQAGYPIPHSVSTLNKDRSDPSRIGGVPFYRVGGKVLYNPEEVLQFYSSKASVVNQPEVFHRKKLGRPGGIEQQEAIKAGFTKLSGKADITKFRQSIREGREVWRQS